MDDTKTHITCACGAQFQVLQAPTAEVPDPEWDEAATAELYQAHRAECAGAPAGA